MMGIRSPIRQGAQVVRRSLALGGAGALLCFGAACASRTASTPVAQDEAVAVRVVNNTVPPTTLEVWMVPGTGIRVQLGVVTPGDTALFTFENPPPAVQYQLMGETTAGGVLTSRSFTIAGVDTVSWNVSLNTIRMQ